MFSCSRNAQVTFVIVQNYKHCRYQIDIYQTTFLKVPCVVNRALPSLHGGPLKITLTVPLSIVYNNKLFTKMVPKMFNTCHGLLNFNDDRY